MDGGGEEALPSSVFAVSLLGQEPQHVQGGFAFEADHPAIDEHRGGVGLRQSFEQVDCVLVGDGQLSLAKILSGCEINSFSALLADIINLVPRGQLDLKVANAVGYLASVLLRSLEQGHTEERGAGVAVTGSTVRERFKSMWLIERGYR